jgi:hypothetical protein
MKLPKTIQLDISDTNVFDVTASPGEWAVTGSFSFSDSDFDTLDRKQRIAYQSGWMGVQSGGFSTLVQVVSASDADFQTMTTLLADMFVRDYGAPDRNAAMPVARDEVRYVASLCGFDDGALLSLFREPGTDGIREVVRAVNRASDVDKVDRIWEMVEE